MWRREPYRLLFPLGIALAWLGVLPWLLFGAGLTRAYLGVYHALTMTEGFVIAVAVGFLATMIPRRTKSPPISTPALGTIALALGITPIALAVDRLAVAEAAYLVALVVLAGFVLRRVGRGVPSLPPSFIFLPVALGSGVVGAALLFAFGVGAPAVLLAAGRLLVEQGLLIGLVLAVAPMLTPIIAGGAAAPPPRAPRLAAALYLVAAAAFIASFPVELAVSARAGALLRALVVTAELLVGARLLHPPSAPGLHRRVYQLALALVPLGLFGAAFQPAFRVPLLHLTFVGGIALLIFAVSMHVVLLHTGRDRLASARPWYVLVVAALIVAAALTRSSAERFAAHYFAMLAGAALLWLLATLVWLGAVCRMVFRPPPDPLR